MCFPYSTSVINLRPNTQQAYFSRLHSVVRLNNQFFWTDGNEIYTEELNGDTFYHNRLVWYISWEIDKKKFPIVTADECLVFMYTVLYGIVIY